MPEDLLLDQPRQYGEESNTDEGLVRLIQAQNDEEAMEIEASLLVETDDIVDSEAQIEDIEETS